MKTLTSIPTRFAESIPTPVGIFISNSPRPVRRGNFWPGEHFGTCSRQWESTGVLSDQAFVLPPFDANDPHTY